METLERTSNTWRLAGNGFETKADRVVVATDAYSGALLPALERSLLTRIPLRFARQPLLTAAVGYYRLRDRLGLGA